MASTFSEGIYFYEAEHRAHRGDGRPWTNHMRRTQDGGNKECVGRAVRVSLHSEDHRCWEQRMRKTDRTECRCILGFCPSTYARVWDSRSGHLHTTYTRAKWHGTCVPEAHTNIYKGEQRGTDVPGEPPVRYWDGWSSAVLWAVPGIAPQRHGPSNHDLGAARWRFVSVPTRWPLLPPKNCNKRRMHSLLRRGIACARPGARAHTQAT